MAKGGSKLPHSTLADYISPRRAFRIRMNRKPEMERTVVMAVQEHRVCFSLNPKYIPTSCSS